MESFKEMKDSLESQRQFPNKNTSSLSTPIVPHKRRGLRESGKSPSRNKYSPYVRSPSDVSSIKKNSQYPNVTLNYQFDTIEVCNQWLKAQVSNF